MLTILFVLFLGVFVSILILSLGFILYLHIGVDREKSSPFECGFDPKGLGRIPFSTRFFLLVVLFLVFDVEIALLIPLPIIIFNNFIVEVLFGSILFIFILILGLLHEWREGSLDWKE